MSRDNSDMRDPWEEPARETSYQAHQRLKRQKQRARQLKANDAARTTSQSNTRGRPQAPYPDPSIERNIANSRSQPASSRQPSQLRLPSELPYTEQVDADIPSQSSLRRTRAPEMYAREMDEEDLYDSDDPSAPPPRAAQDRRGRFIVPTADLSARAGLPAAQHQAPRPSRTRERAPEPAGARFIAPPRNPRREATAPRRARPRNRGFGSVLLIGCIGGLVMIGIIAAVLIVTFLRTPLGGNLISGITSKTYTQSHSQSLPIPNLSLVQIQNQVGNVNVNVSSSVSTPMITTLKKVTASSSSAANSQFAGIAVAVQQPVSTDLTISATLPKQGNSSGDSVDITLTLPATFSANAGMSITFDIKTISGNLNVQQIELAASSCLMVQQGNLTFSGSLDTSNPTALVPCTNTSDSNPHPWYTFQSEVGNLDVTLPAATNITLNAATNAGTINGSAFGLTIPSSDNSASYDGPLTGGSATPAAELKLDVGTGNIQLHQQ